MKFVITAILIIGAALSCSGQITPSPFGSVGYSDEGSPCQDFKDKACVEKSNMLKHDPAPEPQTYPYYFTGRTPNFQGPTLYIPPVRFSAQLILSGRAGEFTLTAQHINDDKFDDATLGFSQPGSGRIERLSNNEYDHLQKLRQAVADAETEIAKAHGVDFGSPGPTCFGANCIAIYIPYRQADHFEFHGQFLLVNVPAR